MKLESLTLKPLSEDKEINYCGNTIKVKQYLPVQGKIDLINFVVDGALDERTGCFSPIRTEVFFIVGMCRWYTDIEFDFTDANSLMSAYDILCSTGLGSRILGSINENEFDLIRDMINETTKDIARYNSSAAGIIQMASQNTDALDGQLSEILGKVKDGENLDVLSVIKDMVGKD